MNFATLHINLAAIKLAAIKKILEDEDLVPEIKPCDSEEIEVTLKTYVSVKDLIGKEEWK